MRCHRYSVSHSFLSLGPLISDASSFISNFFIIISSSLLLLFGTGHPECEIPGYTYNFFFFFFCWSCCCCCCCLEGGSVLEIWCCRSAAAVTQNFRTQTAASSSKCVWIKSELIATLVIFLNHYSSSGASVSFQVNWKKLIDSIVYHCRKLRRRHH